VSVERGIDPRSCALVAFGGGGPLHACALAELLGMRTILVPPHAGVLSALGLAIAPERRDAAASVMRAADDVDQSWFGARLDALATRAANASARRLAWHARVRYAGQGHELDVACAPGDDGAALAARFATAHAARYGFTLERSVEVVAVRVAATGEAVDVSFAAGRAAAEHAAAPRVGHTIAGPHVETLADATMVVAPGWTARALEIGGWMVEKI
jgi:N-methylhydantoinase A